MSKKKSKYIRKSHIDHILDRSEMYIGSKRLKSSEQYIGTISEKSCKIFNKTIRYSPAILRIFIEALSNAVDNSERSRNTKTPCTTIKININSESGLTMVYNDGEIVPIELHENENIYNHTLVFGKLMSGSNYNDEEDRLLSGRFGLGIKLTNIFSKKFTVEGNDPNNNKSFKQEWSNNMKNISEPIIKNSKLKKGFTKVSWIPDFDRFNLKKYTKNIINLYLKYIVDAAMLCKKVKIYFNDIRIPIKSLIEYSKLYNSPTTETLYIRDKFCEVVLTTSDKDFQHVSFVNGIFTRLGGNHVDAYSEALFRPIVDKFNKKSTKKSKKPKINIKDVKQFFKLFVVCSIIRPEFDGQEKNSLQAPEIQAFVKKTQISKIAKWSVMQDIEDIIKSKEMIVLKKVTRKKNIKINNLDKANYAGGKYSNQCSLFVCEGLSAKTYVVGGINTGVYGKKGRDWFGILALSGKVLNCRNATPTVISKNKVVTSFIQALGLQYGVDYTKESNFKKLNYGRVILICDADNDGLHIESLVMNIIHYLFPSLLERNKSFLTSMKTPIARVFIKKSKDILFYDENRFNNYISEQTKKVNAKYYKGLGTTKEEDIADTFGVKIIEYINDEDSNFNMNKVFHKSQSDARKKWLSNYDSRKNKFSLDDTGKFTNMKISNFLNNELIKFSIADCARSIPHLIDGLKVSQRKILYAVFKRKLKYSGKSMKVAQLSGYTAEHSCYHHGEQNLQDTIVGMASNFMGSNNIPILYPDGSFGSRIANGKDAASARYIFTKLEALTEFIYIKDDEPLLTPVNNDGDLVEPEFYIPIIPMILANGVQCGIGTGHSCNIPCYNPLELVESIRTWLKSEGEVIVSPNSDDSNTVISMFNEITPWYRDFKGTIEYDGHNRYITYGIINKTKHNTVEVSELPIGMSTNKFKEYCEDLILNKKLKSMKNYSTVRNINFVLTETSDGFLCNIQNLKLFTYLSTNNMVLFNDKNKLKKYNSVDIILNKFCQIRYIYYIKRKKYQLNSLEIELKILSNKKRFIKEIINKKLIIMNTKECIVLQNLKDRNFDTFENTFEYLLRLQVRTFTKNKIRELKKNINLIKEKITILTSKSEKEIWLLELKQFEKAYKKWIIDMNKRKSKN